MPILDKGHREAIVRFVYKGGDSSLTYKYILSPFAQFCVDYLTPKWVAPNVITLTGLMATAAAVVLSLIVNPNLESDCPSWLSFLTGLSIFAYQTLDNMDGKQARRTGSSSPLGMLFDHSCDAINAAVISVAMASVIGTGWTPDIFFCLFCGYVPFYFQTWEEYYTGEMVLPVFNGPSEGLLMSVSICWITCVKGSKWWHQHIDLPASITLFRDAGLDRFEPFTVLKILAGVIGFLTVIDQVGRVLIRTMGKGKPLWKPLLDLTPFLVSYCSSYVWCVWSPVALKEIPITAYLLMTSVFVEIVVHILVVHMAAVSIEPMRRVTAWLMVLLPLNLWLGTALAGYGDLSNPQALIDETFLTSALCCLSLVVTTSYLVLLCTEFADALNIFIFVIGSRPREKVPD